METTTGLPAALRPITSWRIASEATAHPPVETKHTHSKVTPTNNEGCLSPPSRPSQVLLVPIGKTWPSGERLQHLPTLQWYYSVA